MRHREPQAQLKSGLSADYEDNDLVCCNDDGRIWIPESITNTYYQFAKRIGVAVRFHDLRHTHASQLLRAGISAKVVSERLGLPGMQEEAAAKMDVALRSAIGKHARPVS